MQKMTVLDLDNKKLFTGTKQECMHFIKRNKLDRTKIKIRGLATAPIVIISNPEPDSWVKRMFKK